MYIFPSHIFQIVFITQDCLIAQIRLLLENDILVHRTFLLYQNNVRKTWSVIKETLQRKKKHEMPGEFVWNNRVITDMTDIANEFNRYFISIGHTLSEQIQSVHSCEEYLGHKADSVFKFSEVNEERLY